MAQIKSKFHLAFGGAEPFARLSEHAYPAGASFCTAKRRQKRVKGDEFPLDKPL